MRMVLPIKIVIISFLVLFFGLSFSAAYVHASDPGAPTATPTVTPAAGSDPKSGFALDQEVTFVGKAANRSYDFLEWTLSIENYRWITLPDDPSINPIRDFWVIVRNIVFVLLALFVLGASFVMIVTRGQNLTIMRFIPRFFMIVILVLMSFALIRFMYQATDVVQGFFLKIPDESRNIGPQDLLDIAFPYDTPGFRKFGIEYDESAFISLLLVKLTSVTYYVMTALLLIRKIILWFFIIVSPIFPLLLFFRPVRNTAKIWVGEFFRWLLYAPLFALFLHGLVNVWRSGIPMSFDFTEAEKGSTLYPTAISILLGGPGQQPTFSNTVNLQDTFALYVVALLMLWVVILLPFLLLQIFLDYINNTSISENPVVKKIANNTWFNRAYGGTPPPTPPGQPPQQPGPFGLAKNIPFLGGRTLSIPFAKGATISNVNTNAATNIANTNISSRTNMTNVSNQNSNISSNASSNISTNMNTNMNNSASSFERSSVASLQTIKETKDVLKLANLSIPKMRDVARYETSMLKHDSASKTEVSRFHETLEKITKPAVVAAPHDRERFTTVKEKLVSQQKKGDKLAQNVLSAGKVSEAYNNKTKAVIPGQVKTTAQHVGDIKLPSVNAVQQVSIEEYEDVKKMWTENYQNMETPVGPSGVPMEKKAFIQQDVENITETINLLSSQNQENVDKGMDRVANILPFLLLGGFSKAEVISYLKAKLEAGKSVLGSAVNKDEDDTLLDRDKETSKAGQAEMVMHKELPEEQKEPKPLENLSGEVNQSNTGSEEDKGSGSPPPSGA